MNTAQEREQLERVLYELVTSQVTERLNRIRELKKDSQNLYSLVLEEVARISASLERRQNRGRRKDLVTMFSSIVGVKTLLEVCYPHLNA
jgi:hypothetical protein